MICAGGKLLVLGAIFEGQAEHRTLQLLAGHLVDLLNEQLRLGLVLENDGDIVLHRVRPYHNGLDIVFRKQVAVGRLGLHDGVILAGLELGDDNDAVLVAFKVPQEGQGSSWLPR